MREQDEWSGFVLHPVIGPGRMGLIPACPACHGIKAELVGDSRVREIRREDFGHRPDCKFFGGTAG